MGVETQEDEEEIRKGHENKKREPLGEQLRRSRIALWAPPQGLRRSLWKKTGQWRVVS